ncbi:hypothetical protein OUZ56_027833 [Daphnia magna]|uniref:Uncharacterized protein n=1 Tax=Daphnia magna TaxID=35525 RepID=A0ABR0B228_9CRUS|nr:hypothetical protein OUZ56_027833 [Daphnia magna]
MMLSFPGRHPSTKPWVIDDIHCGQNCVLNWYHFYKTNQNYVDSLLHWTADLDHLSILKEIMCLNENGSPFATSDLSKRRFKCLQKKKLPKNLNLLLDVLVQV